MDRALRNQSCIEQLGMPSSPPVAAWRRSLPAIWCFVDLACGWFRLARACGHGPRYIGPALPLRATTLAHTSHLAD
eukprot:1389344-Lingulodinium_polyedra.AAC.1